jgi:hypothetical protein
MSQVLKVTVDVSKETHELGNALAAVMAKFLELNKDGWDWVGDTIDLSGELMSQIGPAVSGADLIPQEFRDNPEATLTAETLIVNKELG